MPKVERRLGVRRSSPAARRTGRRSASPRSRSNGGATRRAHEHGPDAAARQRRSRRRSRRAPTRPRRPSGPRGDEPAERPERQRRVPASTWRRCSRGGRSRRRRADTRTGRGGPPHPSRGNRSGDFVQRSGLDVVDEPARAEGIRQEVRVADPLDALCDALLQVRERQEVDVTCIGPRVRELLWSTSFVKVTMPQSVCLITSASCVPSSQCEITSERSASSETTPPALRMTWASPSSSPAYFAGSSLASMQVTIANLRRGASADRPSQRRKRSSRLPP